MFAGWSFEALEAYLVSEGYDIPAGTTEQELREYVAELNALAGEEAAVILEQQQQQQQHTNASIIAGMAVDDDEEDGDDDALVVLAEEEEEKPRDDDVEAQQLPVAASASALSSSPASRRVRWAEGNNLHEEFAYEATYDEEVGEQPIDNFAKPTRLAAEAYASLHHPRRMDGSRYSAACSPMGRYCFRNGGPVSSGFDWLGEGTVSELTKYGSGLTLHFKNLKLLFWLFFFASIAALPQLVLNWQNSEHGGGLLGTTLGNLLTIESGSNSTRLVFLCGNSEGYLCDYSVQGLASLYTVTEVIVVLLFTCAVLWMQYFIPKEHKIVSSLFLSLDLYSVWVPSVPAGCGEEALRRHFEDHVVMTDDGEGGERIVVDDVNIAYDDGELITLFMQRGEVLSELWRVTGRVLLEFGQAAKSTTLLNEDEATMRKADRVERLVDYYDLLLTTYHSLNEQTRNFNKGGSRAISAVVTFQSSAGVTKALLASSTSSSHTQLFQGMQLKCVPAPPPSTIQWENIQYSACSQVQRQVLAALVVCVAIFGSFAANLGSNAYRHELSLAHDDDVGGGNTNTTSEACSQYDSALAAAAMFDAADACYEYWRGRAPLFVFTVLATAVVALVNYIVGQVSIHLAPLEKHHSLNSQALSVALRLFVAYSVNTCFVFVLVNLLLVDSGQRQAGVIGNGDLDLAWYANVGAQILLMMLFNLVTPHLPVAFELASRGWLKWCGDRPLLQRELNERSIGPNFPFAVRSAQIMMQSFVSLVFGPGMPLMYPIAMVSFVGFYLVDKTCVLRLYRTPPEYGAEMSRGLALVLWLGMIGNVLFAIWAYSVPGLFNEQQHTAAPLGFLQRVSMPHTLPLVILGVVVLCLFVLTTLVGLTLSFGSCCGKKSRQRRRQVRKQQRVVGAEEEEDEPPAAAQEEELLPPLPLARQSGWLRGLKSYNILQNPKYRRAFGVPKSFCDEHAHVNSVVALPEGEGLPELPDAVRQWLSEF